MEYGFGIDIGGTTVKIAFFDCQGELLDKWDCSSTTLRHVKEFLKQNGFEVNSLSQMRRDYL